MRRTIIRILAVTTVAGCGRGPRAPAPVVPLDSVVARAREDYRQGRCKRAQPAFARAVGELSSRDPGVAEATYYLAECDFAAGLYLEASRQFRRVADLQPSHPLAADALLRAGDALAQLWKHPELDPEYGENALAVYRELLGRYPDSPASRRAGLKLRAMEDRFAEKDFNNAVFYYRLRAYDSAIIYFRSVVANYAQSRFAPLALMRLVEAYRTLGYSEEEREACEHLQRYYPDVEGLAGACPAPSGPP